VRLSFTWRFDFLRFELVSLNMTLSISFFVSVVANFIRDIKVEVDKLKLHHLMSVSLLHFLLGNDSRNSGAVILFMEA